MNTLRLFQGVDHNGGQRKDHRHSFDILGKLGSSGSLFSNQEIPADLGFQARPRKVCAHNQEIKRCSALLLRRVLGGRRFFPWHKTPGTPKHERGQQARLRIPHPLVATEKVRNSSNSPSHTSDEGTRTLWANAAPSIASIARAVPSQKLVPAEPAKENDPWKDPVSISGVGRDWRFPASVIGTFLHGEFVWKLFHCHHSCHSHPATLQL